MITTNLQEEFINDKFKDIVILASRITGFNCHQTIIVGDPKYGDNNGKYQITLDSTSLSIDDQISVEAFNQYFYANFGKWVERCYFDTPENAFFALMKAWYIWNSSLSHEIKNHILSHLKNFI